jgi:hypothetical protein
MLAEQSKQSLCAAQVDSHTGMANNFNYTRFKLEKRKIITKIVDTLFRTQTARKNNIDINS